MHVHDDETLTGPVTARVTRAASDASVPARLVASGRADALDVGGVLRLQRAAGNAGVAEALQEDRSPVHDVVGSGGSSLDGAVRADMESRFAADFGDVRVHTGSAADHSARSVGAHAYTVGSDIVFQRDAYDPASDAGRHTLAHELAHVLQQRSGPVDGRDAGGGIRVSDPSDRFEREASSTADRVLADPTTAPAVQRLEDAGPVLQREEATEAPEEEVPDEESVGE